MMKKVRHNRLLGINRMRAIRGGRLPDRGMP